MTYASASVEEYLAEIPQDRVPIIREVIDAIRANIDPRLELGMQYGMVGFYVPHSVFPDGYHCDPKQPLPVMHVASQKNFIAVYAFCLYMGTDAHDKFVTEYEERYGKKLDCGKSCLRFKKPADVPVQMIADLAKSLDLDAFIATYIANRPEPKKKAKSS